MDTGTGRRGRPHDADGGRRRRGGASPTDADPGRVRLARALLLVQAGVIAMAVVESAVVGAASPNLVPLASVNLAALGWTLLLRRGLGRGSETARRWVRRTEFAWMLLAVVDLALSLALARRLEPVPVATRLVLPWAIRRMTRVPLAAAPAPPAPLDPAGRVPGNAVRSVGVPS